MGWRWASSIPRAVLTMIAVGGLVAGFVYGFALALLHTVSGF